MELITVDKQEIDMEIEQTEAQCLALEAKLSEAHEKLRNLKVVLNYISRGQATSDDKRANRISTEPLLSHTGYESVAQLIDMVLVNHEHEVGRLGRSHGLTPAQIKAAIFNDYGRQIDSKKINSRLFYLKQKSDVGYANGHYFIKRSEPNDPDAS